MALVSMRQFARENGVHVEAIRKAIAKKRLPALVGGKVHREAAQPIWEAIRDVSRAGRKRSKGAARNGNAGPVTPVTTPAPAPVPEPLPPVTPHSYDDARTRREYLRVEREELMLARERGQLVDSVAVRTEFANMVARFRSKMRALGHRIAPVVALPEDRQALCTAIDEAVDEALTELAKGDDQQ